MKRFSPASVLLAILALVFFPAAHAFAQAPSLGTASNFAVLGGSGVTNTGATVVDGEVGSSPTPAVTGFPPGIVINGTIHANDAVAQQAQSDLTVAYNSLAGLACGTNLTGQDLGGLTLQAGVYCFASSAQLTGILTLDAQGDPNAEFIFQIGSTLTTASNSAVLLINSGESCNVYWQVGSSATLGTSTQFVGNILALTSITMTTSANASGRLLARNGAVTLDTNGVSLCAAACPAITLSPDSLPNGLLGAPYNQLVTAIGGTGPYTFSVVSGSLPTGLALSTGGTISGTPTAVGSFTFTVRAEDASGCFGSRVYTIVINSNQSCPSITLTPSTLPAMVAGTPFSQQITAVGGTPAHTFSITSGAAPPGIALSTSGLLSGTPTAPGSYSFTITAADSAGCLGSQLYTAQVNCPVITISPSTLPAGATGAPYGAVPITASGGTGPYTFAVVLGALPPGLSLSSTGSLSGTPTAAGNFTFTVRASDSAGCTGERIYTMTINCPFITLLPAALPAAFPGTGYNQVLTATGGTAPYTFAVTAGALPAGLTLSSSGTLSGTPTSSSGPFTVTVTDANRCQATRVYSLDPAAGIPMLDWLGLSILVLVLTGVGVLMSSRFTG
jgi:hypothetical protein